MSLCTQVADLMGPGLLDCFLFREKILQPLQLSNITDAWNVLICNSHVSTVSRTLNITVRSLTICLLKMEDSPLRKLLVVIEYHWLSRFTSVWKKGNHCELLRLHVNMLINMLNNIEIYYFPKLEKKVIYWSKERDKWPIQHIPVPPLCPSLVLLKIAISNSLQGDLPTHAHNSILPLRHSQMALKIAVKNIFAHFLRIKRTQKLSTYGNSRNWILWVVSHFWLVILFINVCDPAPDNNLDRKEKEKRGSGSLRPSSSSIQCIQALEKGWKCIHLWQMCGIAFLCQVVHIF